MLRVKPDDIQVSGSPLFEAHGVFIGTILLCCFHEHLSPGKGDSGILFKRFQDLIALNLFFGLHFVDDLLFLQQSGL